jgi:hypothetical protein
MNENFEIGKISFNFDKKELERITQTGKLGAFVEKATELFRQSLKGELVNNAASGATSLFRFDDDEYGTGPRGPFPHIFAELDVIAQRIKNIEIAVNAQNLSV